MGVQPKTNFAILEGTLIKLGIPEQIEAWNTVKELERNVGKMSARQITLIQMIIEQVVSARDEINKQKILKSIKLLVL